MKSSVAYVAELQTHVTALEDHIGNHMDKQTTNGPIINASTSAVQATSDTTLNNSLKRRLKRGSNSGNDQGPAASSVHSKGSAQNKFRLLSQLALFSGNPANGEKFLDLFIARNLVCSDKERLYWCGILCGPTCTLLFKRSKILIWEAACCASQAGYTIRI